MMKRSSYAALSLLLALTMGKAHADTSQVPTGVRALVYKHVEASVPLSYDSQGFTSDYSIREILGTNVITGISADVASAYNELHKVDAALAESVDLGKIDVTPEIKVKADAFGLAWGLSDRLMVAVGVPVMKASVTLSGGYYNSGAIANAAKQLRAITDPNVKDKATAFAQVLEQLPEIKGEYLEGVIVNNFGYKPVGNWYGSGIGDVQLFAQYKTYEGEKYKNALKFGVELPTGRTDDPDNLLDIPFGSGYYKTYLEAQNDYQIVDEYLALNVMGRYQYDWSADRTYRLRPSLSFPLTSDKENIHYKPGNVWLFGTELSTKLWKSVGFSTALSRKIKSRDSIHGARSNYDYALLEHGTDTRTDTLEATLSYSTVDLFLRKRFPVPLKIGATVSRVIAGRNTEQVNQTSLNFEMYF